MNVHRIGAMTALAASLTFVTLNACEVEQNCTLMGCTDSFTLMLESSSGPLVAANYGFQITFDGTLVDDCVVLISDDAECGGGTCIVQNTCALVDAVDLEMTALQLSTLMWEGGVPESVGVSLSRDGEGILERTLTPNYTEFFPNGEECDASGCLSAEDTLSIPNG